MASDSICADQMASPVTVQHNNKNLHHINKNLYFITLKTCYIFKSQYIITQRTLNQSITAVKTTLNP